MSRVKSAFYARMSVTTSADPFELALPDTNTDAAFREKRILPSKLLLAYTYGAAAVERWGHNWKEILSKKARPNLRRPAIPQRSSMGPSRIINDRNVAIEKCEAHGTNASSTDVPGSAGGPGGAIEEYDAMDFVAFCWYNTHAAQERREQSEQAFQERISTWLSGVSI
ncbi:hypothetical protein BC834DRAFT_593025 [Gloeopeniophorella convolvens]|nr:hypothetical protein BC834DRAFT_593025 [Gloeopeniophorella convolvens]